MRSHWRHTRRCIRSRVTVGLAALMFLYVLIFMAYHSSRRIPRTRRLKFQTVNVLFMTIVLVPQLYVLASPKSSRYCRQPLLNNLSASVALSFIASGFAVTFTLLELVPQGLWASYHLFGLLSFGQGLSTTVMTLSAAACVQTTPELYFLSAVLTAACVMGTVVFMVRGGLWLTNTPLTHTLLQESELS